MLDESIEEIASIRMSTQLLMAIPGISYYSSLLVTAEIEEVDRFSNEKQLVSDAGLVPTVRQVGDRELRGGISKACATPLRWILNQRAYVSIRYDAYLKQFYRRLEQRKHHHIAIVVTAQKLLVSSCFMWTREVVWNPPEVAG